MDMDSKYRYSCWLWGIYMRGTRCFRLKIPDSDFSRYWSLIAHLMAYLVRSLLKPYHVVVLMKQFYAHKIWLLARWLYYHKKLPLCGCRMDHRHAKIDPFLFHHTKRIVDNIHTIYGTMTSNLDDSVLVRLLSAIVKCAK